MLRGMRPYSNDLRSRIVATYERGERSLEDVATLLAVSVGSVKNFVRRYRETGSADARPHAGGQALSLTEQQVGFVHATLKVTTDLTLEELRHQLKQKYRKQVSAPTLSRYSSGWGYREKKVALRERARHRAGPTGARRVSTSREGPGVDAVQVH